MGRPDNWEERVVHRGAGSKLSRETLELRRRAPRPGTAHGVEVEVEVELAAAVELEEVVAGREEVVEELAIEVEWTLMLWMRFRWSGR